MDKLEKFEEILAQIIKTENEYEYSHYMSPTNVLHITARHKNGDVVGRAQFSHDKTTDKVYAANRKEFKLRGLIPENSEVHKEHRNKGVANRMYRLASQIMGQPVKRPPKEHQTEDAQKFWQSKGSEFGKSEDSPSAPKQLGLPRVKLNPEHGKAIADAYHQMKHDPNHPEVKSAYDALKNETKQQFDTMLSHGIKVSVMKHGQDNPYKSSDDMHRDLEQNKHLWLYPTDSGFGTTEGDHKDHPLLEPTGRSIGDHKLLANDEFRAVHDYFGHFLNGKAKFGHKGEHQSYLKHKRMFSPLASKALATETMGQNNWVGYGPYAEHNKKYPEKTKFAEQKAGLLPDHIIDGDWHNEK
jgi:hypothetical protein